MYQTDLKYNYMFIEKKVSLIESRIKWMCSETHSYRQNGARNFLKDVSSSQVGYE